MPYRRSGSRYTRRRSRAKHMWVRAFFFTNNQIDNDSIWMADLLAPLRRNENLLGTRAAEGSYTDVSIPEGATITRILGRYTCIWQTLAAAAPEWDDEQFFGCTTKPWLYSAREHTLAVPTAPEISPYDPADSANTSDWMAWGFRHWSENASPITGGLSIGGVNIEKGVFQSHPIDIRAKRRLREAGDTPVFCTRFGGATGAGPKAQRLATSVLLSYH